MAVHAVHHSLFFVWITTGPTMHLSRCCTPRPMTCGRGCMCTAHCGCMWLTVKLVAMVKINRSLNLHLAPPPPTPSILNFDPMTFVSWCWPTPLTSDLRLRKQNTSRPKRPPLTEAPETQRSGRAHHSESPVRLAARPAIVWVGQREQRRRQTPDPQESRVGREAAEHRRWEFAQESPLCRVTEAQMEQGGREWEKERMRYY